MEEKHLEKTKLDKKSQIIQNFKNKWLISRINTILLILILIAIFFAINIGIKKWDPTPIDLTTSKDFTLTEESKQRIKTVEQDVNIYFTGYDENNIDYKLAKQYNKANSLIKVKIINLTENQEIAKKYNLSADSQTVIVESGKNSRVLEAYDLINYDEQYNTVDIAEQKITSAIINVTADRIPTTYFLEGFTSLELNENGPLSAFSKYLSDEVLTLKSLNILKTKKVPDDCNSLIIMTPEKDFDDFTTNEIIKYIKKGGNLLWFNGVYEKDMNLQNVNKVLAEYGIDKFEKGVIYETDKQNIILGYSTCFAPTISDNEILKNVRISAGVVFLNATKININEEKLKKQNIEKTELIITEDTTYFTENLESQFNQKEDKKGTFVVGAQLEKTISEKDKEEKKSTLIIYGNDIFITDSPIQIDSYTRPLTAISLANNKDVALNSLAKLNNKDQEITIRKSYSDSQTSFTPTDKEKIIISMIIFSIPIIILIIGFIVCSVRRRRN